MRKRFSTEKAEWSKTREHKYQQDCENIVVKFNDKLLIQEDEIQLNRNDGQIVTIKPLNHKTLWYETWLKLKDIYNA